MKLKIKLNRITLKLNWISLPEGNLRYFFPYLIGSAYYTVDCIIRLFCSLIYISYIFSFNDKRFFKFAVSLFFSTIFSPLSSSTCSFSEWRKCFDRRWVRSEFISKECAAGIVRADAILCEEVIFTKLGNKYSLVSEYHR